MADSFDVIAERAAAEAYAKMAEAATFGGYPVLPRVVIDDMWNRFVLCFADLKGGQVFLFLYFCCQRFFIHGRLLNERDAQRTN